MKGILSAIIIGICIILASAILVGALTYPMAFSILLSVLFWIVISILAILGIIFVLVIIAAILD